MSKIVEVDDVSTPAEPKTDLDVLADYLSGPFLKRKEKIAALLSEARELHHKATVIDLVYEALLFRQEAVEWQAFARQLLDEVHGDQLGVAHSEQASEAKERGSTRPLSKMVEARAQQFTAPLRRASTELGAAIDWADKIVFWCQSQSKMIRDEEYGSIVEQAHAPREKDMTGDGPISHPPSPGQALRAMRRSA